VGKRLQWYVTVMATYTTLARSDGTGFDVEVVGANGVRHTRLGFATKTEAEG
jgi:hypothetical protein